MFSKLKTEEQSVERTFAVNCRKKTIYTHILHEDGERILVDQKTSIEINLPHQIIKPTQNLAEEVPISLNWIGSKENDIQPIAKIPFSQKETKTTQTQVPLVNKEIQVSSETQVSSQSSQTVIEDRPAVSTQTLASLPPSLPSPLISNPSAALLHQLLLSKLNDNLSSTSTSTSTSDLESGSSSNPINLENSIINPSEKRPAPPPSENDQLVAKKAKKASANVSSTSTEKTPSEAVSWLKCIACGFTGARDSCISHILKEHVPNDKDEICTCKNVEPKNRIAHALEIHFGIRPLKSNCGRIFFTEKAALMCACGRKK